MNYTYEMNPCRLTEYGYEKCLEDDADLAVWSVYRRGRDGCVEWLSDHATRRAAVAALRELRRHSLPNVLP